MTVPSPHSTPNIATCRGTHYGRCMKQVAVAKLMYQSCAAILKQINKESVSMCSVDDMSWLMVVHWQSELPDHKLS